VSASARRPGRQRGFIYIRVSPSDPIHNCCPVAWRKPRTISSTAFIFKDAPVTMMMKFFPVGRRQQEQPTQQDNKNEVLVAPQGTEAVELSHITTNNNNSSKYYDATAPRLERISAAAQLPPPPNPLLLLNPREQEAHATLSKIQYYMDDWVRIPGTQRRIGLDPLIGLLPLVGDVGSAMVSLGFVARAAPVLSRYTVLRMLVNVWIDAVVGVVPLLGDVFDVGWKANQRNLKLFEKHMEVGATQQAKADRRWVVRIVIAFVVVCLVTTLTTLALVVVLVLYLTGKL
jgi:hypothetical protein